MTDRTGWHCGACNRYFQTLDATPPDACRYCGEPGLLRRIDHPTRSAAVTAGDVVACEIVGETEEYVVGTVVEVGEDRVLVDARDGTGRYEVKPEQVVATRTDG